MKQSEVAIGKVYQVKVSGQLKAVKLVEELASSAYTPYRFSGRNVRRKRFSGLVLSTGRKITLTAGRLRKEIISKPLDNATAEVANLEQ